MLWHNFEGHLNYAGMYIMGIIRTLLYYNRESEIPIAEPKSAN